MIEIYTHILLIFTVSPKLILMINLFTQNLHSVMQSFKKTSWIEFTCVKKKKIYIYIIYIYIYILACVTMIYAVQEVCL